MKVRPPNGSDDRALFEVITRHDDVWISEQWTPDQWRNWLEQSTPRQLVLHVLYWTELAQKLPERRGDLAVAVNSTRQYLLASEGASA